MVFRTGCCMQVHPARGSSLSPRGRCDLWKCVIIFSRMWGAGKKRRGWRKGVTCNEREKTRPSCVTHRGSIIHHSGAAENCNHTGMRKTVKHKHPRPKAGGTPGGKIAPLAAFTLEHFFFFLSLLHFLLVPHKQTNHSDCIGAARTLRSAAWRRAKGHNTLCSRPLLHFHSCMRASAEGKKKVEKEKHNPAGATETYCCSLSVKCRSSFSWKSTSLKASSTCKEKQNNSY